VSEASPSPTPDDVLAFWMGDGTRFRDEWFRRDEAFDARVRERFGGVLEAAARGGHDAWTATPRGRLALVVVLDQLSRNALRGTAGSFAQDARARKAATEGIDRGEDRELPPLERMFLYMPLVHAEDRAAQARAVSLFEELARDAPPTLASSLADALRFARMHRDIMERFGRFPHRNAILGRESTAEEIEFLKKDGSRF
jgi:uncharacterized protein (DUF924 family)